MSLVIAGFMRHFQILSEPMLSCSENIYCTTTAALFLTFIWLLGFGMRFLFAATDKQGILADPVSVPVSFRLPCFGVDMGAWPNLQTGTGYGIYAKALSSLDGEKVV